MVAWSTVYIGDVSSTSSSDTSGGKAHVEEPLRCYVCDDYFNKPRILPCGHTFCSSCILRLRENAVHDFNKTRDKNAHRRGECGYFTCPWPNCHYSMKIMNVRRWSVRNKSLSQAVILARRHERPNQNRDTQTDKSWSDVVLSVPKKVLRPLCTRDVKSPPQSATEIVLNHVIHQATSADCSATVPSRLPIENNGKTWKHYALMFGMVAMDTFIKSPI